MRLTTRERRRAKRMARRVGRPCDAFEPCCIVCQSWALFHETGRITRFDDALQRIDHTQPKEMQ